MQEATTTEIEQLEKVREKCISCQKCPLGQTRTNIVFSGGVPNHKLMLIGEAPGYYEDQKGEPFVGKAGQLLDKIFASVGLSRQKDVYICNTLKCRPPDNPRPAPRRKSGLQRIFRRSNRNFKTENYTSLRACCSEFFFKHYSRNYKNSRQMV